MTWIRWRIKFKFKTSVWSRDFNILAYLFNYYTTTTYCKQIRQIVFGQSVINIEPISIICVERQRLTKRWHSNIGSMSPKVQSPPNWTCRKHFILIQIPTFRLFIFTIDTILFFHRYAWYSEVKPFRSTASSFLQKQTLTSLLKGAD